MSNYIYRDELIHKIKMFNQIFELDFVNSEESEKSWKSYLDPIAKHLFGSSYLSFIKDTPLDINVPPGAIEKYYNVFAFIVKDFQTMIRLRIPNEIYCAAEDVKKTFDDFIKFNNIDVSLIKENENGTSNSYYQLYPTL